MTKNSYQQRQLQSPYLNVDEAARYLLLTTKTLNNYRWAGYGPKYRKHGGRVVYRKDDLDHWSEQRSIDCS